MVPGKEQLVGVCRYEPEGHGPQEAGDKGTEGSRVTSCPCVDETMPSVNKPKLAVMRGWVNKRKLFEMQSVMN